MADTKVKLHSKELDRHQTFSIGHAERILKIKNPSWTLNDPNFEINANDNIVRRSTRKGKSADQSGTAANSGTA